ncbi:FAD-binding oxidoreductase [Sulfurirhabdus autotrophica]|uniref:D-lactate dehydrogenase n=1 Tax=Sulfurirhabdus autotrophica TaxID=1706046 RepID=A0A4R3XVN1_9PROT|nr:FAD-linked oxidase C-terminal domain-containing protein [Sulfurirhabdus autotrophica]TCV83042.1 D-lactate dehydrogenase [Sulfurirhabdus autotrophica]
MLTAEFLAKLTAIVGETNLLTDPVDCYAYAYDNSRKIFPPLAVAFAISQEQIQAILLCCNEYRIPITPRGRGTGTAGGSLPEQGGLALSLERMSRIISIDPANRIIIAEPGVLNQEIQDAARPHGFFWPPDPSSAPFCTIGGNLATSAGGPHAVKYGTTRDHVLGLKAITGKGELIKAGCNTTKGVVGYDLTRLLIGSEGTLAIITEATLKLTPLPQSTGGITAHYKNIQSCAKAIAAIMAQPKIPSALEFLDKASLDLIRSRNTGLLPDDTHAMLMIEVDGSDVEINETGQAILTACKNEGLIKSERVIDSKALWVARKALSPLLRDIAPKKINEDVVVPVSRLPELLQGLTELSQKYRIANANFGHAGNGNIHVNLLVNPDNPDEMNRAEACLSEVFNLVLALNGTLSGEHGIGSEKRAYVGLEIDSVTMNLMKEIKHVFDPNNILNPGKLFPKG